MDVGLDKRAGVVLLSCAMPDYTKITICGLVPSRPGPVRERKATMPRKKYDEANINKQKAKAKKI